MSRVLLHTVSIAVLVAWFGAAIPAERPAGRTAKAKPPSSPQLLAQAAAPTKGLPPPEQVAVPPPPRFDITRFDVQGNSLLDAAEVGEAVGPFTGKSKDFADVQRALEALQDRYQRRGFGTVQVVLPEQELEAGVIVLRVIEPKLGKVTVEGNKFFDDANIRRSVPALVEGATPNAVEAGRNARLANENPAKRTTVLLRAGATEGEVDATVRVQDEKFWRAAVTFDNTGSPTTGMYRLGVGFQHSNLFGRDHTLTIQYQLDPEPLDEFDKLKVLGIGYRIPFYHLSSSLDLLFGYSDIGSATGQVIQGTAFNIAGSGTIAGVRYNYTLPRIAHVEDFEHKLSFGLDYKAFSNQVAQVLNGVPGQNLTPDVTVYPASITYSGTKRMENAELSFYGSVAHNIYTHGSDAYREKFFGPEGEGVRPGAGRPTYTVWRYGLNYVRAMPSDYQIRANITGQWSRDALIPGEQFGIGGWDNLRGMLEREASSDRGYRTSLELYTPELGPKLNLEDARMRFLAFLDWGRLRQNFTNVSPCTVAKCLTATSIGIGARVAIKERVSVRVDYGRMLDGGVEGDRGDDRWHFGMAVAF